LSLDFRQLIRLAQFFWAHSPSRLKYLLLPLALVSGVSRDLVMIIVNKAAVAPIELAIDYWLPLFIVSFVFVLGSTVIYHILAAIVTTRFTNEARLKMIGNLLKAQPDFVAKLQHGAVWYILTTDMGIIATFVTTVLNILPSVVFLLIALPQLFYYSHMAGIFAVLVMIGGTAAYYFQQKLLAKLNADARQLEVDYFEQVTELLWGLRELRLHMPRRQAFMSMLESVLGRLQVILIRVKKIFEIGEMTTNGLRFMLFGGIVFLVPYLVKTEATATFQLLTFVLFSLIPYEQIVASYPYFISAIVTFDRIREMNGRLEAFQDVKEEIPPVLPAFRKISLRQAVASYKSRETSDFRMGPINFNLKRGEVVFLIGNNGSGKSTFMNVLAGLHDLDQGELLVDGKLLVPDDMGAYRARFSAIYSWYHIFREMHGLEHIDAAASAKAIERVGLTGITEIEDGKITRIDLSAGQKRRLAMAISLMEDRDILVLDEFVAEQDPSQREWFFRTLIPELKSRGKTIVVSTHDLAWLDCADRIYKFEQGKMTDITPKRASKKPEATNA
jgi:putative pyoverdin transport system ATP-binding/permease protein